MPAELARVFRSAIPPVRTQWLRRHHLSAYAMNLLKSGALRNRVRKVVWRAATKDWQLNQEGRARDGCPSGWVVHVLCVSAETSCRNSRAGYVQFRAACRVHRKIAAHDGACRDIWQARP